MKTKINLELIEIPLSEYNRLTEAYGFLECLKAMGVDNWEGYHEAWRLFNEGEDED